MRLITNEDESLNIVVFGDKEEYALVKTGGGWYIIKKSEVEGQMADTVWSER